MTRRGTVTLTWQQRRELGRHMEALRKLRLRLKRAGTLKGKQLLMRLKDAGIKT